jgi:hypothetical protein
MSNEMQQQQGDSYFEGHPTGMEEQAKKMHEEMMRARTEMERICYEVLEVNPDGQNLWKKIEEQFLIPNLCSPRSASFKEEVIYFEGFREAFRHIKALALNHKKRILGG